jgi:hypothetical protein
VSAAVPIPVIQLLQVLTVALGAPGLMGLIAKVEARLQGRRGPRVLQPVFAGFSILSPTWLWIELPVMLVLVILLTFALSGRRLVRVRRVPARRTCATPPTWSRSWRAGCTGRRPGCSPPW